MACGGLAIPTPRNNSVGECDFYFLVLFCLCLVEILTRKALVHRQLCIGVLIKNHASGMNSHTGLT